MGERQGKGCVMSTGSVGSVAPTRSHRGGSTLRDAWVAIGAGLGGILAGMLVVSTSEEG
jgi:hypothetical protein